MGACKCQIEKTKKHGAIKMNEVTKILSKFAGSPGLLTKKELRIVKKFMLEYQEYRDMYREVFAYDPIGKTLDSHLEKIEWYIEYTKDRKK